MPAWWDAAPESALWVRHSPPRTRAAVITLHGGPLAGHSPVRPWQLAALRMRPVLRSSASAVSLDETLLGQVRYRRTGWNDGDTEQDALRALSELGRLVGDVPVVVVGHAMGGRAALRVAAHPQVRGVVALAPWLPAGEPVAQLVGRSVLLVQGHDGRASGVQIWDYAERARAAGARVGVVVVRGGGPWMMRRAGMWHRTVASAVRQVSRPPASGAQGVWSSSGPVFV